MTTQTTATTQEIFAAGVISREMAQIEAWVYSQIGSGYELYIYGGYRIDIFENDGNGELTHPQEGWVEVTVNQFGLPEAHLNFGRNWTNPVQATLTFFESDLMD